MFNHKEAQKLELFTILSENFQETIIGGSSSFNNIYDIYFQFKNVKSFANNENNFNNGINKLYNAQNTGYELSEFNIGFNRNDRKSRGDSSSSNLGLLNILLDVMSIFS
ncbi:hypothetical protein I8752_07760 [Nostocaceae cyanobacterium CENA369]|uniref:Uncharacterized protein n=1 Tax=Dendronalium phyllosphericum CENA369 TaxID=1725256 RepID=A0A8J7I2L2_9NOST|nr:hypothetical protein [Dendronalium phyllosphericum]MBH8572913.1 hypothetical protein [Dendronalium phyllosphericum CENA369]